MSWNRNNLNLKRKMGYSVVKNRKISSLLNIKKWDYVSQQILLAGDYFRAWDWLIANNYDADTLITGRKGNGKTTLMLGIAEKKSREKNVSFGLNNILIGRNVFLVPELIKDEFGFYSVIAIDEIQYPFHKTRSTSTANVEANKFMDMKRKWKINVLGTMPKIDVIDRDLREEKAVFWINCYKNVNQTVHTVIYANLQSKDGKYRDFVKIQEKKFGWCGSDLYFKATNKWNSEFSDVDNLEDYKKRLREKILKKRKQEELIDIKYIVKHKELSDEEKCLLLLDLKIAKVRIESYLKVTKNYVYEIEAKMDLDYSLVQKLLERIKRERGLE